MATPAVVFKIQFLYNWYIRSDKQSNSNTKYVKGDFTDYLERPSAFLPKLHSNEQEYKDFLDYMKNDEKSKGAFDTEHDLLTHEQLNDYRTQEMTARENGCPKYSGVISFNNEFLRSNGILVGSNIDYIKLKNVARNGINKMIDKSDKLSADNINWIGAIHENTDNIHIHFAMYPLERTTRRNHKDKNQDCIEQDAIKTLKSTIANGIINQTHTPEITRIKREILFPQLSDAMGDAEKMLLELANKFPPNIAMQYANHRMKPFQREIDKCVDKIIGSDPELKKSFDLYVSSLGMMDRQYQDFYGDKSQALTYSEHQMEDFYNRAGNILLKHIKEMKNGEFPDAGSDELIKRLSDKGVSGREEKKDNDELRNYLLSNNKYISNYTIANNALDLIKDDDDIKRLESVADISDTAAFALGMYYKDKDKKLSEKYLLMSANNNDRDSQYQLGKLYLSDDDIKQGAEWMRRSADNGHAYAQYAYGIMMLKNNSPEEGLYYLNNSFKNGNKIAHKVAQSYKKKLTEQKQDTEQGQEFDDQHHFNMQNDRSYRHDYNDDTNTIDEEQTFDYDAHNSTVISGNYHLDWTNEYKQACKLIYSKKSIIDDYIKAEQLLLSEAKNGNVLAIHDLGKLYNTELLGAANKEKSDKYYHESFDVFNDLLKTGSKHTSYIQYRIGKMYSYGLGVEANDEKAYRFYSLSAESDNKYAMYSLANCYYYGKGTNTDHETAFKWYSRAAQMNMPYANYAVAQMYQNGDGTTQDLNKAYENYRIALDAFLNLNEKEQADDNLLYKIGYMYKKGLGTDVDVSKSLEFFAMSAKQGNKNAIYEYGKALIEGTDITPNISMGETYLKKAIKAGNTNAERFLANEYLSGKHIPLTTDKVQMGMEIFKRLADQGDTLSAYRLGKVSLDGKVTPRNVDLAERYLLQAYNSSEHKGLAAYSLGKLYMTEGKCNHKKAIAFFKEVADTNNWASYQLGKIYFSDKNASVAKSWFKRSASDGNEAAKEMLRYMQRTKKAPMLRRSVAASTYNANMCWSQLRSIMAEYDAHIKQLQREFDYENQISNDEYLEYTPYY